MQSTCDEEERAQEAKTGIKHEFEQTPLRMIRSHSTISQFIKSGQAAFSSVGSQLLQRHETSDEVHKWMLEQVRDRLSAASDLYHDDILILRSLLKLEYSPSTTGFQLLFPEILRLMKLNLTYAVAFTNCVLEAPAHEVPRGVKDDLLHNVAQQLGTVSIDMRKYETIDPQLAAFDEKILGDNLEPRPLAKHSSAALGLFTKHFYGAGLHKPIGLMLAQLQSEMQNALVMDIHTIYVPFLQELIGLMLMYGIPLTDVTYSSLFESVLQNYFKRFVDLEPKEINSVEHRYWKLRANAALRLLESFDHSYFRDILGDQYATDVLPAMMQLQGSTSGS